VTRAAEWTKANVPDQTGRVVLVTGANSGIGLQTARILAGRGAHVVMACRTRSKAEAAKSDVLKASPDAAVSLIDLDLGSLASVREAAAACGEQFDRLDLLINNAGVMATPRGKTVDGFETQFGTNHLGHFALTGLLMPSWNTTEHSRIVTISSLAHRMGRINFDDLQSQKRYQSWPAYGQSKLANLLFTLELQRRLLAADSSTIAVAAHPGLSNTGLMGSIGGVLGAVGAAVKPLSGLVMQGPEMGALPTVRAAVDPNANGGDYYGPDGFMEQRGLPKKVGSAPASKDLAVAKRLWTVSEELTGVSYLD
jgi:NAD(P)-dependent dehydrogenase (short-subunit alcohol dehydrogenase family)